MIDIAQRKLSVNDVSGNILKLNDIEIKLNKELILKDIDRYSKLYRQASNKYNKSNLKSIVKYLKKIEQFTGSDNIFILSWTPPDSNGIIESYPFKLMNNSEYGVDICNYIELNKNQKFINIDLSQLYRLIAIEFMYRDLGETNESIEKLLSGCGIVGFNDPNILLDYFSNNGDDIDKLSRSMRIENTPYKCKDTGKMRDYFYSSQFESEYYRDIIAYSLVYANTVIANNIVKNTPVGGVEMSVVMISDTNISFILTDSKENGLLDDIDKRKILDEITVRIFGRQFLIEPKVTVF